MLAPARNSIVVFLAALAVAGADVAEDASARRLPAQVWGVEMTPPAIGELGGLRERLRSDPLNALVARRNALGSGQLRRARRAAHSWGHAFLVAVPVGRRGARSAPCRAWERRHARDHCALLVRSRRAAARLARKGLNVAVRLSGPGKVEAFRRLRGRGRIVVLVALGADPEALSSKWTSAITLAEGKGSLDLVVSEAENDVALDSYLEILRRDRKAPSKPAGFAETGDTTTTISLAWQPSKDNVGVVEYRLYRDGTFAGRTGDTTFTVPDLACGKAYDLAVEARDAAGNASRRATMSGESTDPCPGDTTAPLAPSSVTAVPAATSVALAWTPSTDDVGVTGYRVYRDGALVGSSSSPSFTVTGLTCETGYVFGVAARDAAGNASPPTTVETTTTTCPPPDTSPPTPPGGLTKTGGTTTSVSLGWTASSDDVGVAAYDVFRDGSAAGTTSGTSHTFSGLACGSSYEFGVEARDAAGNVSWRTTLTAATSDCPPPDTSPPAAPGDLVKTGATATSVSLRWSPSSDDVGVADYRVYRDGSVAGTTSATSYTVSGLACGETYELGVEARDAAGNASARATLEAATAACSSAGSVLYVDRASRGGPCNDARTAEQASSPGTPWCSLARAASAAPTGSTVLVRQARYGDLMVTGRSGLTFEGYPGELPVLVGEVKVDQSSAITVRHFAVTDVAPDVGEVYARLSDDVRFDDLRLDRAVFRARAATGLTIQNSSVVNGPEYDDAVAAGIFCGCAVYAGSLNGQRTSNLTVRGIDVRNMAGDGVHLNTVIGAAVEDSRFHTSHPYDTGDHVDFVQVLGAQDVTIRRNYVTDWRHGILITDKTPLDGPDADQRAMIVENNVIEATNGYAINGPVGANSLVVNNTFAGLYGIRVRWKEPRDSSSATSAGARVWNNVTPKSLIVEDGVAEDYNLASYAGRPPAAHTIVAPVVFEAGYELPACSPGVDSADAALAPLRDRLGRNRVGAPDRGANERQAGGTC